jgi:hypothetical protein
VKACAIPGLARLAFGRDIVDTLQLPEYAWPTDANCDLDVVSTHQIRELRTREYLTEVEIDRLTSAAISKVPPPQISWMK